MNQVSDHPDFHVVGIGASAGGLAALLRFFENMPAQNDMAFVIVLHLSPKHESNIAKLLQHVTKMVVLQVMETVRIEKNQVYVIPPSKNLLMQDGQLIIEPMTREFGKPVAIDLFLRTLAEVHRERAVGIILSGTGSDGAVGIARIREAGGMTIAQEPDDAEYDSMPRSAIETGMVDVILPVADMPQKLIDVVTNSVAIELPDAEAGEPGTPQQENDAAAKIRSEAALAAIMEILHARTGHDFTHYKKATVLRRIERRMQVNCLSNLNDYLVYLERTKEETPLLLQDMLISVTNFFRDPESFAALERDIIPRLFEDAVEGTQIRAWTPGCATGEEAYSIAMLLAEQAELHKAQVDTQVFASDIDKRAIDLGRRGLYPESIVTDVPANRLRQFFTKDGNQYQIKKELREKVLFAAHNILRDPPFSRVHLITCRNLLIYLSRDVQQKIFEMFHFALLPGGYLFLGSSESAEVAPKYFIPVDKKNRIYRASSTAHGAYYLPTMPFRKTHPLMPITLAQQDIKPRLPYADLHQRLLEHYAPPSVLINHEGDIVYLSEKAGQYLRHTGGEPSHNLVALIVPALRLELRTALFQMTQNDADIDSNIETRPVTVDRNGFEFNVSMTIRQVQRDEISGKLIFVLFNESEKNAVQEQTPEVVHSFMIKQLENELFVTKEQLQTTIEQYETSAEELKASNEELQAINEELRSTTEELETSKEELQSINEELITVNHELKVKADETGKSNDDLQNFIASTEIATLFIDRAMRIKRFTPRASDVFNVIASDVGRPLLDITHRLHYDNLESDAAEVFTSLRALEREVESDSGKVFIARLIPYRTTEDKIDGLVLTFIDITNLKVAQKELLEEEHRMALVAASTKDYAIITQDTAGLITSWNSGAYRIFGYEEAEVIGRPVDILFTPEDCERGVPQAEMQAARADGSAVDERWHLRRDGSRFFCSGVTTLLDSGEMRGYARIARDLTGTKEAESRREQTLARETATRIQAENASRMREEFLAVLSHELKQPLNLIHLNAEWLKRMPESRDSAAILRVAETIRAAVISQATIINDLLDLSRVSTGKLALNKAPLDLVPVVTRLVEAFAEEASGKGISLVYSAAETEIPLLADVTRIEQIVWNLLSNAIKFTTGGGRINLSLSIQDDMACIQISDTGEGIKSDFLPHVFEMFNQADGSITREHGGLGIGLALVKQLVDSHNGRVVVASGGPGQGAEFTVWLPMLDAAAGEGDDVNPEQKLLQGRHILLVDDDVECLETFGDLLVSHGATLARAQNAGDALAMVEQNQFDMIVSDIGMPTMDGYQLLTAIRQLPNGANVSVLAVTGFGRMVDVERALHAGFAAHLQKPVDFSAFMRTVQTVFNS